MPCCLVPRGKSVITAFWMGARSSDTSYGVVHHERAQFQARKSCSCELAQSDAVHSLGARCDRAGKEMEMQHGPVTIHRSKNVVKARPGTIRSSDEILLWVGLGWSGVG